MGKTFWIIVIYFVISAVGGMMSRRQKRAREERRRERRPDTGSRSAGAETSRPLVQEPTSVSRPPRQTPEEIAAEIRRVMGLERAESRVEVVEEVYDEPITSYESPTEYQRPGYQRPEYQQGETMEHGGNLHDTLRDRQRRSPGQLQARHLESSIPQQASVRTLGNLASRYGASSTPVSSRIRPQRSEDHRGYVDLSNIARALVTAEILGKPLALRDDHLTH